MPFTRRILHYSPGPADLVGEISGRAVAGAWFEVHRQGGCGAGELRLKDEFPDRNSIDVGDWIAFEFQAGDRWYQGRVEHRRADSPAGVTFQLEGMAVELGEVFPGGFGISADGLPPHRYAATDLFPNDPDRLEETVDSVDEPHELVDLLLKQYVVPNTHITRDPLLIEASDPATSITSLKFRGEESARSIIKESAVRARNASWGVDADGTFFFLRRRSAAIATFREGVDLTSLEESRERNLLFNRVLLTGGYVYDVEINSDDIARRVYRWRGNYIQPASRQKHGERRIRLWVPWIRTSEDSRAFIREFFRTYAEPPTRYLIETDNRSVLPRPWDGRIRIEDRNGAELATSVVETIRVQFDHGPRLRMEIGPLDPRDLWPEPPHDERWEIPDNEPHGGESITLTDSVMSSSGSSLSSLASSGSSLSAESSLSSESTFPSSTISSEGLSSSADVSSSDRFASSSDVSSAASSSGISSAADSDSGIGGSSSGSSDSLGASGGGSSSSGSGSVGGSETTSGSAVSSSSSSLSESASDTTNPTSGS